jgi:hypothetical protein
VIRKPSVPTTLKDLTPEDRHHVYKLLKLSVFAYPDGTLEVSGTLVDGENSGYQD